MQLVTFGIDKDKNLIVQFPVFVQPYTQKPLILYQLETVPIHILDQNDRADSYTHLQVEKPCIALNSVSYTSLWQEELRTWKKIGYELYCRELFIVKHKTKYSCESAIYFNLGTNVIKENCNFRFYYNKTAVTPTVVDGGNEIFLANWPNDKHIICTINNDIPIKIPSHPYDLVKRGVLCNCSIEADNHYLFESYIACDSRVSKLTLYFTSNTAFTNYLDMFPNLTESLQFPIIKNKTMYEQTLPINLNISGFDKTLLNAPTNLKDFINRYIKQKEIFDLQERHETTILNTNKKFFSDNYIMDIFVFISTIISLLATILTVYLLCKHKKIRVLIASLVLHHVKEVGAISGSAGETNSECTTLAYIGITLTILSLIIVMFLHYRKTKFCTGHRFSNTVKSMIFISDVQN